MNFEISQRFFFEAAHTLRRDLDAEGSARIHGHTYHAEVTVIGQPNLETGMVIDVGYLRSRLQTLKDSLDHRFLDEISGLGEPTLENLCSFIAKTLEGIQPPLSTVRVWREATGDGCVLRLP